VNNYRDR